jgi:hypothetical protein
MTVRRAMSWPFVGPPVVLLMAFGATGARSAPPAVDVATWCFGFAAILLIIKLMLWITTSERAFARGDRLAAFVMLCAIAMSWYGSRQWVHERQFDDLVATQNADLRVRASQLSAEIVAFVQERGRHAPGRPQPATWDQDEAAFIRYETETVQAFERQFGKPVRATHDIFGLLGIRDRDFDAFYAHPANAFQMRVIAARLASLATKVRD